MKALFSYIKERAWVPLSGLALAAVAAFLFYLYDLPFAALGYILLVTGVVGLLFFAVPGYVRYARRVGRYAQMRENLEALPSPMPEGGPLAEALLLESVGALRARMQEMEAAHQRQQEDMLAYYTLWVHQIKTPMAAMRLILQGQPQPDGSAVSQELFKIERYVEMVLGYLRLETISQDLCFEPCDMRRLAARAAKKFAPQFIYKKLAFTLGDFELKAVTDEKWMLFVLEQLFSNAVKYTHTGGVAVSVEAGEVLVVRDTGVGIAPEDLPRIFQRGFTGQNGRMEGASTGLGLYLVKRVLDTLQTPIEIRPAAGRGTEVRLFLGRGPVPRD